MPAPSTKERILAASLALFNERGYGNVTMRMIADFLSISVGNLTYHFPKKQDIVNALMDESFRRNAACGRITTLAGLYDLLSLMLDTLTLNAFFFLDDDFAHDERHIHHHQPLRALLSDALTTLTADGIFLPSFDTQTRETLLTLLLMSHITWLKQTLRPGAGSVMSAEEFLHAHFVVFFPYFTLSGLRAYEQLKKDRCLSH